jgi:hypothetical protein
MKVMLVLICAAIHCSAAWSVNKCTDAAGKVVYSDALCPVATRDTKMEWKPSSRTNTVLGTGGVRDRNVPRLDLKVPIEAKGLMELYRRWFDAERVSFVTARLALAPQVTAMQELVRRIEGTSVHSCMESAKVSLVQLVRASVDAHIAFLDHQSLVSDVYQLVNRGQLFDDFESKAERANCPSRQPQ